MVPAVIQLTFSKHLLCSECRAILAVREGLGGHQGR